MTTQNPFYGITGTTGIRIMNVSNNAVYSDNWSHCPVLISIQDDSRTMKLFVNERLNNDNDYDGMIVNNMVYGDVSRVAVVNPFIRFERYDLFKNGCSLRLNDNGVIIIEPLSEDALPLQP